MRRTDGEGTVYLRPDGSYLAQASLGSVDGKRRRISAYGATAADARARLAATIKAIHEKPTDSSHTVESWAKEWLRYVEVARGLKASTRHSYAEKLRLHVIPSLGAFKLELLTGADIDRAVRAWSDAGMSQRMREMCFGVLRSMLIYAVHKERIGVSPHLKADRLAKARPPQRPLWTPEQLQKFLAANPYALWRFLLVTGCRLGEALGLTWGKVDLAAGIRIDCQLGLDGQLTSPKTPKSVRTVALDSATLAVLRELQPANADAADPVFRTSTGTFLDRSNVRRVFLQCCLTAGVPSIRLHDLRHTCATHMLRSGVAPDAVAARLGHADLSITLSIYSHLSPAQHQAAADVAGTLSSP